MPRNRVLIVDDEPGIRRLIRRFLQSEGYEVSEAATCREALERYRSARPDVTILDYELPDGNALNLLPKLGAVDPSIPTVLLTAHGTIDLAVQAIKEGAEQFLTKPVELPSLLVIVERLLENQRNRRNQLVQRSQRSRQVPDPFLGSSAAIRTLAEQAARVLDAERPTLILGETGTGKTLLASWLHRNGPRAEEAFVDFNCAGLTRELLESELFGHERGAFTGAVATKLGILEVADRGTVFLDEIGDMDPHVQPKLLKVIEESRFRRVGDLRDRHVDVQLIAATHRKLGELVRQDRFRQDLYYRISTIQLRVPALRERPEDIPILAEHLIGAFASETGRTGIALAPEAIASLQAYAWPGNVREMRNVLERAVLLANGPVLGAGDLHFDTVPTGASPIGDERDLTLREVEIRHIERVLADEDGHVARAARRLGVPRSSLYDKLRRHGISAPREPEDLDLPVRDSD